MSRSIDGRHFDRIRFLAGGRSVELEVRIRHEKGTTEAGGGDAVTFFVAAEKPYVHAAAATLAALKTKVEAILDKDYHWEPSILIHYDTGWTLEFSAEAGEAAQIGDDRVFRTPGDAPNMIVGERRGSYYRRARDTQIVDPDPKWRTYLLPDTSENRAFILELEVERAAIMKDHVTRSEAWVDRIRTAKTPTLLVDTER